MITYHKDYTVYFAHRIKSTALVLTVSSGIDFY